jgi:Rad3-related DNA helicase
MKRIQRQAKRLKLNLSEGDLDAGAVNRAAINLFEWFHGALKQEQLLTEFPPEIIAHAAESMEVLVERLKPVRLALYWAAQHIDPEDVEKRAAVGRLYDAADLLTESLQDIFETPDPNAPRTHVTYAEVTGSDMAGKEVTLHRKPIETRPIFQRILGRLDTAIFTSATLAAGNSGFRPVAEELGLDPNGYRSLQAESPFEYARQVRGYVPSSMPELRAPEYHTALAEEIIRILTHTQGKAFVLFTSIRDMRKVHELVAYQVRFPILLQGEAPKEYLVEQFQATPNSVLMGVKTFWQGVDIPGEALSCVVLVKLPFPQPEHPMNKARCELIEQRGGNGFRDFSLPRCIRDVRQGFGRLIRTKTDTGLFAILDPRLRTARYGSTIANSLPNFPCSSKLG